MSTMDTTQQHEALITGEQLVGMYRDVAVATANRSALVRAEATLTADYAATIAHYNVTEASEQFLDSIQLTTIARNSLKVFRAQARVQQARTAEVTNHDKLIDSLRVSLGRPVMVSILDGAERIHFQPDVFDTRDYNESLVYSSVTGRLGGVLVGAERTLLIDQERSLARRERAGRYFVPIFDTDTSTEPIVDIQFSFSSPTNTRP